MSVRKLQDLIKKTMKNSSRDIAEKWLQEVNAYKFRSKKMLSARDKGQIVRRVKLGTRISWLLRCIGRGKSGDGCEQLITCNMYKKHGISKCTYCRNGTSFKAPHLVMAEALGIMVRILKDSKRSRWLLRCVGEGKSGTGCRNLLSSDTFKLLGVSKCRYCRTGEWVHGRWCKKTSDEMKSKVVVGWRRYETGTFLPVIACATKSCCGTLIYKSTKGKPEQERFCVNCTQLKRRQVLHGKAWRTLLSSARQTGHAVKISFSQFIRIRQKECCHYCEKNLPYQYQTDGHLLDRVNPWLPYQTNNLVMCCGPCNLTKNRYVGYFEARVIGAVRAGNRKKALALLREEKLFTNHSQALSTSDGKRKDGREAAAESARLYLVRKKKQNV